MFSRVNVSWRPSTCTMAMMDVMICTCGARNPRKHADNKDKATHQSGRRRSGLARRASARWSISRCFCRLKISIVSTCTSLVAQLHLEYTWSTHNRQRHLPTQNTSNHRADAVARVIGGEEITPTLSRHFRSRSSPALHSSLSTASSSASSPARHPRRPRRKTPLKG